MTSENHHSAVVMVMVTVSVVIVIVSDAVVYISERKYAMVTSVSTIYNRSGKERGAFIGYLPSCCSVYLNKPNCHNGGNIVLSTWAWILIETYGLFSIYNLRWFPRGSSVIMAHMLLVLFVFGVWRMISSATRGCI